MSHYDSTFEWCLFYFIWTCTFKNIQQNVGWRLRTCVYCSDKVMRYRFQTILRFMAYIIIGKLTGLIRKSTLSVYEWMYSSANKRLKRFNLQFVSILPKPDRERNGSVDSIAKFDVLFAQLNKGHA